MKTKLKALVALSICSLLTFYLSLVALAETSNEGNSLLSNPEVGLAPGGIGVLATTINVTQTVDGLNDGDGFCSLREAIEAANADIAVDACPPGSGNDVIILSPGTYHITYTVPASPTNSQGDLDITSTLTISGVAGAGSTVIDDDAGFRIFDIDSTGVATITGVTVVGGDGSHGGGIRNQGTLLLLDSTVTDNEATSDGGGIYNDGSNADLTITHSIINLNRARTGAGGGIFNRNGTVTINNSLIFSNTSVTTSTAGVGGGVVNSAESSDATLTINQSTISTNTVNGVGGGGISNSANANRTATVILNETEVSDNIATSTNVFSTTGFGGGIRNGFFDTADGTATSILTLNNSTVSGNTAFNGGGIASGSTLIKPTLTLRVTLNNSTVSGNTANGLASPDLVGNGGGLVNQNGTMNLVNSTVSGNMAKGGTGTVRGLGGGILNSGFTINTMVALSNSTVTSNTAALGGHALANLRLGTATEAIFRNTIIAGGCSNTVPVLGIPGTLTSLGYNMDDGNTCGLTDSADLINTNPTLGSLQDNGGNTQTHALLTNSPAIDAGTCSGAPNTDQRGQTRPNAISAFCDIGAYESSLLGTADLQITKKVSSPQPNPGQTINYTLIFANNGPAGASGVVITDVVPITLTNVTSLSTGVPLIATPGITFGWTVGDLARSAGGVITIIGQISSSVAVSDTFTNTAIIGGINFDGDTDNNSSQVPVTIGSGETKVYLPIIIKSSSP